MKSQRKKNTFGRIIKSFVKKCEENVTEPDGIMDALTLVCEKILIYIRKILCEKLNRLNGDICAFIQMESNQSIILK